MRTGFPLLRRLARALILGLAPAALLGSSAESADRVKTLGGEVRLLVGGIASGRVEAGLDIRLLPGWKTYWRYPGDSGIPPIIEVGGSENIASARLLFPAPMRFPDGEGVSIGYRAPILLPIEATLVDPARPARLKVEARLGVCREICVPVEAELEAVVAPGQRDQPIAAAIAMARLKVPLPAGPDDALAIAGVTPDSDGAVRVVTRLLDGRKPFDLFAEGPEGWALPLPRLIAQDGSEAVFRVVLDGLPPGATASGASLRLTLVNGDRAVERTVPLD